MSQDCVQGDWVKADEDLWPVIMCRVAQCIFYLNPVKAGCKNDDLETFVEKVT